jgi:ATP-dependent Lon protease
MKSSNDEGAGTVGMYPVLPLRDIVVFPHKIVPLFVGREKSVRALEDVGLEEKQILLVTQKNPAQDEPAEDDIYTVGTLASVVQLLKLPDQTVRVLVEGKQRARIRKFVPNANFFQVEAEILPDDLKDPREVEGIARSAASQFEAYIKLNRKIPPESQSEVQQIADPSKLADVIASHITVKIADKQALLETTSVAERLEKVFGFMEGEMSVLQVERKIRTRVKRQMEKTQREYYLNEQLNSERAGRGRRTARRARRTRRPHQEDEALERGERQGDGGAQEAAPDVADVGRGHRRPQLSRLDPLAPLGQEEQGQEGYGRGRKGPRRRSLRA